MELQQAVSLPHAMASYETRSWNSEPQNIEQEISNDEVWNRYAQSFFKNNNDRIPYFDIRYSLFDIRYSLSQRFFFDLTGRSRLEAVAYMKN
jgi:hypothetical protein